MDFKIDRKVWLRGEGGSRSRLLRPSDGMMCCLGQVALQCGYRPEDILNKQTPGAAGISLPITESEVAAMAENDLVHTSDYEKEQRLSAIFEYHGHTITFHD